MRDDFTGWHFLRQQITEDLKKRLHKEIKLAESGQEYTDTATGQVKPGISGNGANYEANAHRPKLFCGKGGQ